MVLREVLATNRKILRLTLDCLQYYLDKFQPLRPSRLADWTFRYKAIFKDVKNFERPWRLNPAEVPYPVQAFESPSWIEQQRVIRALWRIGLFYEFKDAIGTSCILWPEKDISRAWTIGLKYFYDVPMYLPDGDGARLMEEDLCADSGPITFEDTLLEDELVRSVLDYLAEDRDPMLESTYFQFKAAWEPPLVPPIQHERGWESLDTCHNSPMWRFFYLMSGPATQHKSDPMSPLQHVPFLPFRRLGLAIWCRLRLSRHGFLSDLDRNTQELYDPNESMSLCAAWRSVLSAEERANADAVNEKMDYDMMNTPALSWDEYEEFRRKQEADQAQKLLEVEEEEEPEPVFGLEDEYTLRKKSAMLRMREEDDSHGDGEASGSEGTASEV
ncbi:hypothetical protein DL95DRAFT_479112 [Leptodontidium sp. 2 PMI_412]|nr:hypothetical protein DL95DRAFT_479112 [Leptodontidium sp. 2 PMI_412]